MASTTYHLLTSLCCTILLLMTLASANSVPQNPFDSSKKCCFDLNAIAKHDNPIAQDQQTGNQTRIDSQHNSFCITDGVLVNFLGHNCEISASEHFTCTANTPARHKFSVGDDHHFLHSGCPDWLACPSPSKNIDIYSDKLANSTGCTSILIQAGDFRCSHFRTSTTPSSSTLAKSASNASAAVSMLIYASQISATLSSTSSSATPEYTGDCNADLFESMYLLPSLIVSVSSTSPNKAFGSRSSASIATFNSTIFSFQVPSNFSEFGGICALFFEFPFGNEAAFPYQFSGIEKEVGDDGGLDFALLDGDADENTTYTNMPKVLIDIGRIQIEPGNVYNIIHGNYDCSARTNVSYLVTSVGGLSLNFIEDDGKSSGKRPLGLYVVHCK